MTLRRLPLHTLIGISCLAASLSACGGAEQEATPAEAVAVTASAPAPPPATAPPVIASASAAVSPAPSPPTPAASAGFVMPDLVGSNLQDAQDEVQRTVGTFVFSISHDVDGQGRTQINDSAWQVCDQIPAAGQPLLESSNVDFGVVRTQEECP